MTFTSNHGGCHFDAVENNVKPLLWHAGLQTVYRHDVLP